MTDATETKELSLQDEANELLQEAKSEGTQVDGCVLKVQYDGIQLTQLPHWGNTNASTVILSEEVINKAADLLDLQRAEGAYTKSSWQLSDIVTTLKEDK